MYVIGSIRPLILAIAAAFALPVQASASPPMPQESIRVISDALSSCTGGWVEVGKEGVVGPASLVPRLAVLSSASDLLDERAGHDLYKVAKALLAPAIESHDEMMDGHSFLKCPARPKEAVALLKYLMGETPNDRRGVFNGLEWLAYAYRSGVAGVKAPALARRYYLRFCIHLGLDPAKQWSDGVDDSLSGNVDRAGLRPYLETLAQSDRGDAAGARFVLAEEVLEKDPQAARKWLRYLHDRTLVRLIELEDQKRIPKIVNEEEIAFWAEAARKLFRYREYAARLSDMAKSFNGGSVPTSAVRPSLASLKSQIDEGRVADASATREPIPVRALVAPDGRVLWIEACGMYPMPSKLPLGTINVYLDGARLYGLSNFSTFPRLPVTNIDGKPAYSWVTLPAVHFTRSKKGKLEIKFYDLPTERCIYSSIAMPSSS